MKRNRLSYLTSGLALVSLVAAALIAPWILFRVQDAYQMGNYQVEAMEEMDTDRLSVSYDKTLYQRLSAFAQGQVQEKEYFVTETAYEVEGTETADGQLNLYTILENMMRSYYYYVWTDFLLGTGNAYFANESWYEYLMETTDSVFSNETRRGVEIQEWKRCVVYEEDFDNGITFMMWYLDLEMWDGKRVQLLIDTEDYTLYGASVSMTPETWDVYFYQEEYEKGGHYSLMEEMPYLLGVLYGFYQVNYEETSIIIATDGLWSETSNQASMTEEDIANEMTILIEDRVSAAYREREECYCYDYTMDYGNPLLLEYQFPKQPLTEDEAQIFWGFSDICRLITGMQGKE